jgi:hypothetical protein
LFKNSSEIGHYYTFKFQLITIICGQPGSNPKETSEENTMASHIPDLSQHLLCADFVEIQQTGMLHKIRFGKCSNVLFLQENKRLQVRAQLKQEFRINNPNSNNLVVTDRLGSCSKAFNDQRIVGQKGFQFQNVECFGRQMNFVYFVPTTKMIECNSIGA